MPSARGFLAYGRYMLRFARDNRHKTKLLGDKDARERVEPFLTGETFHVYFNLLYEIEGDLRILLALVLNVIVLGTQIDGSLPVAYAPVFVVLFVMQWTHAKARRQRLSRKPAHDQPHDRAGLHRLGQRVHRQPLQPSALARRLQDASCATACTPQIRAIMTKEGLSAASGIVGLAIVFAAMALIARAQRRRHWRC